MTDHDTGERARQHDNGGADDLRLMDPPTDQGAASHTHETPSQQPAPAPAPATYVRHEEVQPVTVRTETVRPRLDRIRWSSIWAGLTVALALFLFLQLGLVASGIVDLSEATTSDGWWTAGAALVAFLIGGIVAGATAVWSNASDGLINGIVMGAVGLVALVALAAFGGGIALGTFDTSSVFDQFTNADLDTVVANDDAEEAAGWALIGLASALFASALGATIGAKMWPRNRTSITENDG